MLLHTTMASEEAPCARRRDAVEEDNENCVLRHQRQHTRINIASLVYQYADVAVVLVVVAMVVVTTMISRIIFTAFFLCCICPRFFFSEKNSFAVGGTRGATPVV